jgi:hypothetical protein
VIFLIRDTVQYCKWLSQFRRNLFSLFHVRNIHIAGSSATLVNSYQVRQCQCSQQYNYVIPVSASVKNCRCHIVLASITYLLWMGEPRCYVNIGRLVCAGVQCGCVLLYGVYILQCQGKCASLFLEFCSTGRWFPR